MTDSKLELLQEIFEFKYKLVKEIKTQLGDDYKDAGKVAEWLSVHLDREELIASILSCLYNEMDYYCNTEIMNEEDS